MPFLAHASSFMSPMKPGSGHSVGYSEPHLRRGGERTPDHRSLWANFFKDENDNAQTIHKIKTCPSNLNDRIYWFTNSSLERLHVT